MLASSHCEFVELLQESLDDAVGLARMVGSTRHRIEQSNSWAAHLDRYEQLFEQLVANAATEIPLIPSQTP